MPVDATMIEKYFTSLRYLKRSEQQIEKEGTALLRQWSLEQMYLQSKPSGVSCPTLFHGLWVGTLLMHPEAHIGLRALSEYGQDSSPVSRCELAYTFTNGSGRGGCQRNLNSCLGYENARFLASHKLVGNRTLKPAASTF